MGNCMKSSAASNTGGSKTVPGSMPSKSTEPIEFGYWDIKRFGEVTRWVIHYLGIKVKEWNPSSNEDWGKSKTGRGEFPNLPYIKDGDFYLSEKYAIHAYLANKVGRGEMLGKDLGDKAAIRTIEGVTEDFRVASLKPMRSPDKKEGLKKALASDGEAGAKLEQISKFLGTKDYLLGYITLADIEFAYVATFVEALAVSLELESPLKRNVKKLVNNIRELPGIKERISSSNDIPFMPPGLFPITLLTSGQVQEKLNSSK